MTVNKNLLSFRPGSSGFPQSKADLFNVTSIRISFYLTENESKFFASTQAFFCHIRLSTRQRWKRWVALVGRARHLRQSGHFRPTLEKYQRRDKKTVNDLFFHLNNITDYYFVKFSTVIRIRLPTSDFAKYDICSNPERRVWWLWGTWSRACRYPALRWTWAEPCETVN